MGIDDDDVILMTKTTLGCHVYFIQFSMNKKKKKKKNECLIHILNFILHKNHIGAVKNI